MEKILLLQDVRFSGESISEWICIKSDDYFIFYDPFKEHEKSGFKFLSLEVVGRYENERILGKESIVEILYWGYAYFDGVRHLHLGKEESDNCGYVNYPNIKMHVKILNIIHELEKKFCSEDKMD